MTGLFFDYSGDNRVIDKDVNEQQPLATISNITPYRALSPLTGTIDLTYNATVFAANYCKLDSKYYFITDRELLPGGKMSLVLRCDVLKTYAAAIKALPAIASRTQKNGADGTTRINSYLFDKMQQKQVNFEYVSESLYHFDYENNGCLILGAVGGSGIWGV